MSGYGGGGGGTTSSYYTSTNNKINIRQRNKDWLKPIGLLRQHNKPNGTHTEDIENLIRQEAKQICNILKEKKNEVIIPSKVKKIAKLEIKTNIDENSGYEHGTYCIHSDVSQIKEEIRFDEIDYVAAR